MGGTIFLITRDEIDFFHFSTGLSLTHLAGPLEQNNPRMQTIASAYQSITRHEHCTLAPDRTLLRCEMNSRGAEKPQDADGEEPRPNGEEVGESSSAGTIPGICSLFRSFS